MKYIMTLLYGWGKGNDLGSIMVELLFSHEMQFSSYFMIDLEEAMYNNRDVKHKNVIISDVLGDTDQVGSPVQPCRLLP